MGIFHDIIQVLSLVPSVAAHMAQTQILEVMTETIGAETHTLWNPNNNASRVSYHHAHSSESPPGSRSSSRIETAEERTKPNGPTIRQIRQSMILNAPRDYPPAASLRSPMPQKKKSSIFGGFFAAREPTQAALNQVAAQMIAQHGSTSAKQVPNVRMEKMPEHVPKVNAKWDGVPESIKQKERAEKDRQRALKRVSLAAGTRSSSADSNERRGRTQDSTDSRRTDTSHDLRTKSAHSRGSDRFRSNPHRFYAQSVNSSGDLASQQRSEDQGPSLAAPIRAESTHSQSLRSPSGSSLPEIMAFFPEGIPMTPVVPEKYRSDNVSGLRSQKESEVAKNTGAVPAMEMIPEHSSSPVGTPSDRSPVTPYAQPARSATPRTQNRSDVSLESSGSNILRLPVPHPQKSTKQPNVAFLAGEARPFELPDDDENEVMVGAQELPLRQWAANKSMNAAPLSPQRNVDRVTQDLERRPDSSRARLGLRASMLVRTDAAPWDSEDPPTTAPSMTSSASTRSSAAPLSPKYFKTFGSMRSKDS